MIWLILLQNGERTINQMADTCELMQNNLFSVQNNLFSVQNR